MFKSGVMENDEDFGPSVECDYQLFLWNNMEEYGVLNALYNLVI